MSGVLNLRRAIDCYQAALRVYTEADFPEEWRETRDNLSRVQGLQEAKG